MVRQGSFGILAVLVFSRILSAGQATSIDLQNGHSRFQTATPLDEATFADYSLSQNPSQGFHDQINAFTELCCVTQANSSFAGERTYEDVVHLSVKAKPTDFVKAASVQMTFSNAPNNHSWYREVDLFDSTEGDLGWNYEEPSYSSSSPSAGRSFGRVRWLEDGNVIFSLHDYHFSKGVSRGEKKYCWTLHKAFPKPNLRRKTVQP
jgi:hypothetical protein